MPEDDPRLAAADELGGHDEIFLLERNEPPPDDPGELGPADEGDDDRDGEVDLYDTPVVGNGRGQPHPQRNRRNRSQDLNDALNDRIDCPTEIAGDATQDDAQHEAQRHADKPDRHRRARRVHEPGPGVASLRVGSHEEKRL